eukprot:11597-Prorocentrum_minimum.AAC.1
MAGRGLYHHHTGAARLLSHRHAHQHARAVGQSHQRLLVGRLHHGGGCLHVGGGCLLDSRGGCLHGRGGCLHDGRLVARRLGEDPVGRPGGVGGDGVLLSGLLRGRGGCLRGRGGCLHESLRRLFRGSLHRAVPGVIFDGVLQIQSGGLFGGDSGVGSGVGSGAGSDVGSGVDSGAGSGVGSTGL